MMRKDQPEGSKTRKAGVGWVEGLRGWAHRTGFICGAEYKMETWVLLFQKLVWISGGRRRT